MESIAALARVYLAQGNLAEAHAVIQEIVTYVDEGRALDGANEPLQILLTGYQVLAADHHPRAAEMLQIAFDRLRQRVARIPDPATRRSLMENVPWHREIIKAWAQGAQMSLDEALEKISEQSTVRYVAS